MIKTIVATMFVLLSFAAAASEYPVPTFKTPGAWGFEMPDGSHKLCGRISETEVRCLTQDMIEEICTFREPPVFFSDCKPVGLLNKSGYNL